MNETEKLVKNVIKGIQDKKGSGIVVADLSHIDGTVCKYFIICQGNSPQQVEAIAGSVSDYVRETTGEKPVNCIGLDNAVWVAMDYVDVLVHIFVPETRQYYDLEHLWEDAKLETVPDLD
ncbi:MAG: ribosome silencing factor [Prevotella sp.]|jgi:ribosome-associated protein|nr:ribosome silencing factor [Prevotella sp.]MDY6318634.1 ribosome silencing factor [Prevotella sp.]